MNKIVIAIRNKSMMKIKIMMKNKLKYQKKIVLVLHGRKDGKIIKYRFIMKEIFIMVVVINV